LYIDDLLKMYSQKTSVKVGKAGKRMEAIQQKEGRGI
jgi:hypothetical protein